MILRGSEGTPPHDDNPAARILKQLNQVGITLTTEGQKFIGENIQYAEVIAEAVEEMLREKILTRENFQTLLENVQYAREITIALRNLYGRALSAQTNFNILMHHPENAPYIAERLRFILQIAKEYDEENQSPKDLTQEQLVNFILESIQFVKENR